MIYTKTDASGRQIFSDCRTLQLEFDHPPLVKGQWVSNPDSQLIYGEGWREYVPPVIPPAPHDEPDMAEMVAAVKRMLSSSVADLTDEQALEVASLYPTWHSMLNAENPQQPGKHVDVGQRLWDDEELWKVITAHDVLENWRPKDSPSLFVKVSIEEWPAWVQPVGSTDAYPLGAKVTHNGHRWESTVDNNTWEPGVYGWSDLGEI